MLWCLFCHTLTNTTLMLSATHAPTAVPEDLLNLLHSLLQGGWGYPQSWVLSLRVLPSACVEQGGRCLDTGAQTVCRVSSVLDFAAVANAAPELLSQTCAMRTPIN
jgi:hypothetical protein